MTIHPRPAATLRAAYRVALLAASGLLVAPAPAQEPDHYARVAGKGREALVLKMSDPSVAVLEGRLPNGAVTYFDARKRAEAEREGVAGVGPQPVLPAGAIAKYDADEALRYGLA